MRHQFQFALAMLTGLALIGSLGCDGGSSDGGEPADVGPADAADGSNADAPLVVPDAVIGSECANDGECTDGKLCDPYRSVCTPECQNSENCPSWVFCVLRPGRGGRICTPRPPGAVYTTEFSGNCAAGAARCQLTASAGETLTLKAKVIAGNTPVSDTRVQFAVTADGGTDAVMADNAVSTNANGIASAEFQAGDVAGVATAQAAVPGGSALTWKITVQSE